MPEEGAGRVLVIGLDAADRELIERWCDEGILENIARMRARGTWGSLHTTADVVHVSAWPSLFSGTTPDKHGLYHAYVMRSGEQAPARPQPEECPVPFLWKLLDQAGKRCIVMDAFLTCPLQPFQGIQIVDWGSWTWFSGQTIRPAGIKREIGKRFGPYPAEDHSKVGMTPPSDPEGFRERLLAAVRRKAEVVQWLAETQQWDFFLAVFGECHAAGHYFWHYQDEAYIAHPDACSETLRTALRDVYVELDRAIGALLQSTGEGTTVMVVSGDGMGPNYSGSHILGDVLSRMGLSGGAPAGEGAPQQAGTAGRTESKSFLATLRGLVPKEFRAAVSRHLLPRAINERLSLHWKTAGMDWSTTRAFLIDNANEGFIRVNLKGREPFGVVNPEREYDDLCASLAAAAASMTNPANGRRAASDVRIPRELYAGPCREQMPDVIINWDPDALITTELRTESYGVASSPEPACRVAPYYSGNHRPNAFMVLSGPGVAPGGVLQRASILDLAPSVLAHFGLDVPAHMDGRRLELFQTQS